MNIIQFPKKISCNCGCGVRETILTLPVAPCSFARIRFEQIDAPVRPVPPAGALNWLKENLEQGADIKAINIDGPGDPLAEINPTLETLFFIRQKYPDIKLSVTTLGLNAEKHAKSLVETGLTSVKLLIDSVDQKVANMLYAWIRPGRKTIPLAQATKALMGEQQHAVTVFKRENCTVTARTTIYPGFNDNHIEEVAERMAELGVDAMQLVPCRNSSGQEEPLLTAPTSKTMQQLQKTAAKYLDTSISAEKEYCMGIGCPSLLGDCVSVTPLSPKPTKSRPNVAVVSSNGMEVDIHLGQAYRVLIYGPRDDGLACLLGTRPVPEPGTGSGRWEELAKTLSDCFAVLASSAGESPRRILADHGITVLITENEIEGTVDVLFNGPKKKKKVGGPNQGMIWPVD